MRKYKLEIKEDLKPLSLVDAHCLHALQEKFGRCEEIKML